MDPDYEIKMNEIAIYQKKCQPSFYYAIYLIIAYLTLIVRL